MIPTCSWCGTDLYIDDYDEENDMALCVGPGHVEPRMFEPRAEHATQVANAHTALTDGIAAQLGLYDDLPDLLVPGEWADTVVVEYRYGTANPENYKWMLNRWGHVTQGPRKYSVTAFIGSTLGHLSRATNVTYKSGQGTGFCSGNRKMGFWTLEPVPDEATDMTWALCAKIAGIDPATWPLA